MTQRAPGSTPFSWWTNIAYIMGGLVLILGGIAGTYDIEWAFLIGHAAIVMGLGSAVYHSRYSTTANLNDRQGMYLAFSILLAASVYAWGGRDSSALQGFGLALGWGLWFRTTRLDRLGSTEVLVPLVLSALIFTALATSWATAGWIFAGYMVAVAVRELVDDRLWSVLGMTKPAYFRARYDTFHGIWHLITGAVILWHAVEILTTI